MNNKNYDFNKSALIRAFIAINLDNQASDKLETFLEGLRPLARVKWVTRAQFHITLRFLGEQTPEIIENVKGALMPIKKIAPFEIELNYSGAFPNFNRPRVLWLAGTKGRDELINLAKLVNDALFNAEIPREERAFKPHLTLARADGTPLPEKLLSALQNAPKIKFRCAEFNLMRSKLTPQVAIYSKINL